MESPFERDDYTIGWICALAVEFKAALAVLDERHTPLPQESDDNSYAFGRIGDYNIVLACLPSGVYGVTSAANVATLLRQSFPSVNIGLMVGIGGGAPALPLRDVRLGDVVVSEPVPGYGGVLQYDFGKTVQEGRFVQTGVLNKPPGIVLKAITKLKAEFEPDQIAKVIKTILENGAVPRQQFSRPPIDSDRLFQAHYDHPLGNPDASCAVCDPSMLVQRPPRSSQDWPYIHYGLIASGNQVMKHGTTRDKLSRDNGVLCFEMEAAGLVDELPSLVVRGICDYSDSHKSKEWQPYAALAAAAFARELVLHLPSKAKAKSRRGPPVELALPIAKDAVFGAYADQDEPECLPGTRVELLSQITEWAHSPQKGIFWLVGRAGTGKSTISRTVARLFEAGGQLGASFFFKRGEADRVNGALLFTTIAVQLANYFRGSFVSSIQAAIDEDPSIPRKALKEQFDKLIFQPLCELEVKPTFKKPKIAKLVIVIDALDECERKPDTSIIVNLLARLREIENVDVRVLLTSRPELPIRPAFQRLREDKYQKLILHEVAVPSIKHDILLFLQHEMLKIREDSELADDWPGDEKIQMLADMAVPLFIYAATLCRFIGDEYWDPNERIKLVLDYQTDAGSHSQESSSQNIGWHASQLYKTYLPILDQIFVGRDTAEAEQLIGEFQQIVGAIINLANPLSITSLARLLSISEVIIERRLKVLHSVLNVPSDRHTPIRLFHASFRDFLLQGKSKFRIDKERSHQMIASKCIELMAGPGGLKRNICALESPGKLRSEVDREKITRYLSPELQYACRNWVKHRTQSDRPCLTINDETHKFLQEHLLHWLEAMSLLGAIDETLPMIDDLNAAIDEEKIKSDDADIYTFFSDTRRFILRNRYIIDQAPLQTYYSAIIFLPKNCLFRKIFNPKKIIREVCDLPNVSYEWDSLLQTLKGHKEVVSFLAFSPNGKLLASASSDKTVRLWDSITGAPLQTLEGHRGLPSALVFSPDSQSLASGSYHCTVILWSIIGVLLQVIDLERQVSAMAFSSNGKLLVLAGDRKTITLWNLATESPFKILEGHTEGIEFVAFSSDGKLLASVSTDSTILIWDAMTWMPLKTLKEHTGLVTAIGFSPDGKFLVSTDEKIAVWDTITWKALRTLEMWTLEITDGETEVIAFCPNGEYMVLSLETEVILLELSTRPRLRTLGNHISSIASAAFSPNSRFLASGSDDRTIKLWDLTVREPSLTLEKHSSEVDVMKLSFDNKFLLSGSDDNVILWDAVAGTILHDLETPEDTTHAGAVAFSSDNKYLASCLVDPDTYIAVWDVYTGELLHTWISQDVTFSLVFSPNNKFLAGSGTKLPVIELWDVTTGELLQTLGGHTQQIQILKFSWDGKFLASGSNDSIINVWDTASWAVVHVLRAPRNYVETLAFSFDNKILASGSFENFSLHAQVRLWDTATGEPIRTLEGHGEAGVHALAIVFSPDGRYLALNSNTDKIMLWDVATGTLLQIFSMRPRGVHIPEDNLLLSFSPDGEYLNTNRQSFACKLDIATLDCQDPDQYKVVGIEDEWLTLGKERIIWLPEKPSYSVVYGDTIAVGFYSGSVLFFRFNIGDDC